MLKHYNVTEKTNLFQINAVLLNVFFYQIILQAKVVLKHAVTLILYFLKNGGDSNALIR